MANFFLPFLNFSIFINLNFYKIFYCINSNANLKVFSVLSLLSRCSYSSGDYSGSNGNYTFSHQTPTVHPSNLIIEGGSMTVLCIAMGSPPPQVSLFISGILIHQVMRSRWLPLRLPSRRKGLVRFYLGDSWILVLIMLKL